MDQTRRTLHDNERDCDVRSSCDHGDRWKEGDEESDELVTRVVTRTSRRLALAMDVAKSSVHVMWSG